MLNTLKEWDEHLFIFLNSLGGDSWDDFWVFVTQIESWIPLFLYFLVLVFYFYKGKKGWLVFFFVLLTFTVTILFTNAVKELVERLRPNNVEELQNTIRILQHPTSYSFFSGHAASSFSITTFIVLMLKRFNKWIYLAYLWPLLFVWSRIYVGVHYPGDLIVGGLVGTIFALIFSKICQRFVA